MSRITLTAPTDSRLDVLVAEGCDITRSQAAKWIASGACTINGKTPTKAGEMVRAGIVVEVAVPDVTELSVEKEDIPIKILYQDEDIAVVDKPYGMVVHPAIGHESGTLVNALLFAISDLSGVGGVRRPGIVHRLDKDTSGLMLIAKNDFAHVRLSEQFRERSMDKRYLAVVEGTMKEPSGLIDKPLGRSERDRKKMAVVADGRPSQTEWTLLENLRGSALLEAHILTGRTHQIRVHMQSIGHPVAGDPIYGQRHGVAVPRLMLHSHILWFKHPRKSLVLRFEAPPPEQLLDAVKKLRLDPSAPLKLYSRW